MFAANLIMIIPLTQWLGYRDNIRIVQLRQLDRFITMSQNYDKIPELRLEKKMFYRWLICYNKREIGFQLPASESRELSILSKQFPQIDSMMLIPNEADKKRKRLTAAESDLLNKIIILEQKALKSKLDPLEDASLERMRISLKSIVGQLIVLDEKMP